MSAKDRTCFCCGKTYQYCPQCKEYDPTETWKFLVHSQKCLDVYNVWQAYRGKEMTKEEAANVLKALNVDEILKANTPVVPVLKEILDIKDITPVIEKTEEVEKQEEKTDNSQGKQQKQNNHKK